MWDLGQSSNERFRPTAWQDLGLTDREVEVIRLVSLGCSVREIALILGIADSTADNHKARAMRKLGVRKSLLVPRIAIRLGISSLDDRLTAAEERKLSNHPPSDDELE